MKARPKATKMDGDLWIKCLLASKSSGRNKGFKKNLTSSFTDKKKKMF